MTNFSYLVDPATFIASNCVLKVAVLCLTEYANLLLFQKKVSHHETGTKRHVANWQTKVFVHCLTYLTKPSFSFLVFYFFIFPARWIDSHISPHTELPAEEGNDNCH